MKKFIQNEEIIKIIMPKIDLNQIETNIKKTGFVLEYQVSNLLQKYKWVTINSKYYIDDVEGTPREIDIVAYKTAKLDDFNYSTVLIISCKKIENIAWAFLVKDFSRKHNFTVDYFPIKLWTNNNCLQYMLKNSAWKENYIKNIKRHNAYKKILEVNYQHFASQEINCATSSIQNDKNIYLTLSSLMKAQGYELNQLKSQGEQNHLYNFNLLSVNELDFVKVKFSKNRIIPSEFNDDKFIFNYIVNREDTCSRVHFIKFSEFEKVLKFYDEMHVLNCQNFQKLYDQFYKEVFSSEDRYNLFKEDFKTKIASTLEMRASYCLKKNISISDISFTVDKEIDDVLIGLKFATEHEEDIDAQFEIIDFFNSDSYTGLHVEEWLKQIYKYEGEFTFSNYTDEPWNICF